MRFRSARTEEEPEINLIPMIDLFLVIIIFLMLTTTYSKFAELQINLPQAAGETTPDKPQLLNVAVDAQGKYSINGVPVPYASAQAFANAMRESAKGMKEPVIAISADAAATHQSVINVMEASRIAGYSQISFTTQTRK